MAYAQHTILIGGIFTNEYGIRFEYSMDKLEHGWDPKFSPDEENALYDKCNAVIYVSDPMAKDHVSTRCAIVKKTVCYFITNDYNGPCYFEKMKIHDHSNWNHSMSVR